jgi:CRISPR-associated protein Cas2
MKADYLVCYDIADAKRLGKVFRLLRKEGAHIQYSVFLCRLTWPQLEALKEKIGAVIHPKQDDIRIYPLPSRKAVKVLGIGDRIPDSVDLYL